MRSRAGILLILLILALTGCQTAGQIRAEGNKYAAISEADSNAAAAQVTIDATATAVTVAGNVKVKTEPDEVTAKKDFIWWKSVTVNTVMVAGGAILLVWGGFYAYYHTRRHRAATIEAEKRAETYVTFALDAKTGAYPAIGMGNILLLPNQGASMDTTTPHKPNDYMIAGATYIQAARLIAENAAKAAKTGDGSGVSSTNPALINPEKSNV